MKPLKYISDLFVQLRVFIFEFIDQYKRMSAVKKANILHYHTGKRIHVIKIGKHYKVIANIFRKNHKLSFIDVDPFIIYSTKLR